MKKLKILIIMLAIGTLLVACNAKDDSSKNGSMSNKEDENVHLIVDALDREVELAKEIESILVTPIPYPAFIYTIDGSVEKIVAINPNSKLRYQETFFKTLAPELMDIEDKYVQSDFNINVEEVLNLNPDLVLTWKTQEDSIKNLESVGIPTLALTPGANTTIDEFKENLIILGKALNKEDQANSIISEFDRACLDLGQISKEIPEENKVKVLGLDRSDLTIRASKSFLTHLCDISGGTNVAQDVPGGQVQVSMEQIYSWKPDIIYLGSNADIDPEDLINNTIQGQDWSNISVVQNKKVYKMPSGIFGWDPPTPEASLHVLWLAQHNPPDLFDSWDIEDELTKFFEKFYNYDLSQDDIDQILRKDVNISYDK